MPGWSCASPSPEQALLEGKAGAMGDFHRWVQSRDWHWWCWDRALSDLNPCQYHLREQDVSSECATWHLCRKWKNPLDNARVSWECPTGERGHSPGGLCTGAGKAQLKHTLDKEKHMSDD